MLDLLLVEEDTAIAVAGATRHYRRFPWSPPGSIRHRCPLPTCSNLSSLAEFIIAYATCLLRSSLSSTAFGWDLSSSVEMALVGGKMAREAWSKSLAKSSEGFGFHQIFG